MLVLSQERRSWDPDRVQGLSLRDLPYASLNREGFTIQGAEISLRHRVPAIEATQSALKGRKWSQRSTLVSCERVAVLQTLACARTPGDS